MNIEAQRIAIAEACGWRCTASFKEAFACWVKPDGMDHQTELLPDYLNSLDAMHEAEKALTQAQDYHYRDSILNAVCKDGSGMTAITAIAHQRAEAFLRTIGKWEEAK
jgi:hypothetical protein